MFCQMAGNKFFLQYVLKFILFFCMLYYGTLAIIGLASPGGYYSAFVCNYINYISWLRWLILHLSKALLTFFGYKIFVIDPYIIKMQGGLGVHLVYSCIGYGVMSFWAAFVLANRGSWRKKAIWIIGGVSLIFCINVLRISLFLIAINKKWTNILNLDNHSLFNIAAYILIFVLIFLFDKSEKKTTINTTQSSI